MKAITIGELRTILEQIGKGHDHKKVAILRDLKNKEHVVYPSSCAAVQDDRILFEEGE